MPKMVGLARMQQNSISPMFQMFNVHYGPFGKLTSTEKVKVISQAYHDISNFHRAYLTSCVFPDLNDIRVMVTNGYFLKMDLSLLQEFMEGYMCDEKVAELAKYPFCFIASLIDYLCRATMSMLTYKILKNCRKFKQLRIRKEDTVVLLFLSIYKHGKQF
jgi:hypothetical protein